MMPSVQGNGIHHVCSEVVTPRSAIGCISINDLSEFVAAVSRHRVTDTQRWANMHQAVPNSSRIPTPERQYQNM